MPLYERKYEPPLKVKHRSLCFYGALLGILLVAVADIFICAETSIRILYTLPLIVFTWSNRSYFCFVLAWLCAFLSLLPIGVAFITRSDVLLFWEFMMRGGLFTSLCMMTYLWRLTAEREYALVRNDELTGLMNKRGLMERLLAEQHRNLRFEDALTLIFIDCDDFKTINDTLGHLQGDLVLSTVGNVLKKNTRMYDVIARMGGDEFAIILPKTASEHALTVVKRLKVALDQTMKANHWPISFSIGVGVFETSAPEPEVMLQLVDQAMYSVKHTSKDGIAFLLHEEECETRIECECSRNGNCTLEEAVLINQGESHSEAIL